MADLYIRWSTAAPNDVGVRPISPCWPPNAFWTNVSIWMSYPPNHPDPAKRDTTALRARIGEEVIINVSVSTRGETFPFPSDREYVQCQIWACTGANGVGPISALASAGGSGGMNALVIGTIDPGYPGIASALWTPAANDNLSFDPAGRAHVCLAANVVYPDLTTVTPSGQGQFLPQFVAAGQHVQTIFPCGDGPLDPRSGVPIGHFHGQKNIQVLSANAAELTAILRIFGNGGRREMRLLELTERTGGRRLTPVLREHLLAHSSVAVEGAKGRRPRTIHVGPNELERLEPRLADIARATEQLPAEPLERAELAGGGRLVLAKNGVALRPARRPLVDIAIRAGNSAGTTVELEANPLESKEVVVDLSSARDDRPGTVRVFDLSERDGKETLVGGTTFVTLAQAS